MADSVGPVDGGVDCMEGKEGKESFVFCLLSLCVSQSLFLIGRLPLTVQTFLLAATAYPNHPLPITHHDQLLATSQPVTGIVTVYHGLTYSSPTHTAPPRQLFSPSHRIPNSVRHTRLNSTRTPSDPLDPRRDTRPPSTS